MGGQNPRWICLVQRARALTANTTVAIVKISELIREQQQAPKFYQRNEGKNKRGIKILI
jgi:hypothetical protein